MDLKNFSIKREYVKCFNYIKESKRFIYIIILIFLVLAFIGFFVPVPEIISEKILEYIKQLLEETEGFGFFQMFGFIFLNNFESSFIGMVLGIVFGIFPVISAIGNGYVLGFVSFYGVSEKGILILWRLIPHGIFELAAVFISLGMGLNLGKTFFKKKKYEFFSRNFKESLRVFLLVVVPLLFVAAIIESLLIIFLN